MIIPAKRFFMVLIGLGLVAFVAIFLPIVQIVWLWGLAGIAFIALIDAVLVYRPHQLQVVRDVSSSLPLGVNRTVKLAIHNQSKRAYQLIVFDHHPLAINANGLPIRLGLATQQQANLSYAIKALQRGKMGFPCTQIHFLSPLGLWYRDTRISNDSEVHVYPNFSAVAHYALMATDNRLSQMGVVKKRRRGEGQDFHQLREYQKGDSLRQIDWKASSRMRKVISREYQDERDQEIIFLLDCGHRMQAKDDDLSHFDHTLNAILLLAYAALKQGDAVGLACFGGVSRWLPAKKGQPMIQSLLNTVYDLQPTTESPDYSQMAMELMVRQKKRALVILISNLRDEDTNNLLPALKLLRKKHLLLVASMREKVIDETLEKSIATHDDALLNTAAHRYMQQREETFEKIRQTKVISLDVAPTDLSINLVNHYLDIKSSGLL